MVHSQFIFRPKKNIGVLTNDLVMIESYHRQNTPQAIIAACPNRSRQPIYNVINFLKFGHTVLDFYTRYKKNKKRSGWRKIVVPKKHLAYIQEKVAQGWATNVIVGREETAIDCSVRTLYLMFNNQVFDAATLPMKGKQKPNGHQERLGKKAFKRHISERKADYPSFQNEFGQIEGDTIVGSHHKSAVITLVERLMNVIIALKPAGRKVCDFITR